MKRTSLITSMGILSFLFGSCSKPQPTEPKPLPEITAKSEEGFIDLTFGIRSREVLPNGSQALTAYGVHHGREVGIIVVLGAHWDQGSLGSNIPTVSYTGTVAIHSLGSPSDTLIQILDQLYETRLHPINIRSSTNFMAISLAGTPPTLAKGPVKIKLFFESDDETRYAEFYTNIDLANGILEIREKDPDYRSAIVQALRLE